MGTTLITGGRVICPDQGIDQKLNLLQPDFVMSVGDLIAGAAVPNHFRWPNGRQHFRLERVDLAAGEVTIRVMPMHDRPAGD